MAGKNKKIDLNALRAKTAVIKGALSAFLAENNLTLSEQNFERAFQHLLACMAECKDLSEADVRGYLNEALEYHEHNIDMMNKSGLAEESLIKILITADDQFFKNNVIRPEAPQWKFSWGQLPLPVAVSLVLIIGAGFAKPTLFPEPPITGALLQNTIITRAQEGEIKALVHAVSALEDVSYITIYNQIKALPEVTKYGHVSSYKKFNNDQYLAAKAYLEARAQNSPL